MTAPESVTLLPCPFCGGEAECDSRQAYRALSSGRLGNRFAIYCTSCNADMGFCYEDIESENHEAACEEIIAAWNTRQSAEAASRADEDETYEIGKRDGRSEALAEIDLLTGGDGEYFASTLGDDCRDADAMRDKIVQRFAEAASREREARLESALGALCFIDMGKDEDEGVAYTTQEVWEIIHRDRVQDWFSFEDLDEARAALAHRSQAEGGEA